MGPEQEFAQVARIFHLQATFKVGEKTRLLDFLLQHIDLTVGL